MKTASWVLCVGLLFGGGVLHGAELSGVYVNRSSREQRIEFLTGGDFFFSASPAKKGRFSFEKGCWVCRFGETEVFRFQTKDNWLIDQSGDEWTPREELTVLPWKDASPATIVVLDQETRKPITHFFYDYSIRDQLVTFDPLLMRPAEVKSDSGEFSIMAPKSCLINIRIKGGNVVGESLKDGENYLLSADNRDRKVEVLVRTGMVIRGTVVDEQTGKSVKDALVWPRGGWPVEQVPDFDRAVRTDAEGNFILGGVVSSRGINVWHQDYLEDFDPCTIVYGRNRKENAVKSFSTRVKLKKGEKICGVVNDVNGMPISGVQVSDGCGKETQTEADGKFALTCPLRKNGIGMKESLQDQETSDSEISGPTSGSPCYFISFDKKGYQRRRLILHEADPKGLSVVLQSEPVLEGKVMTVDGKPVEGFVVSVGRGLEPEKSACARMRSEGKDGRFSMTVRNLAKSKDIWIGVQAPGFALWESSVDSWTGSRSITVRLKPGVAVRGKMILPGKSTEKASVTLTPLEIEDGLKLSWRKELGRLETTVDDEGKFRFDRAAKGKYVLTISGSSFAPYYTEVAVGEKDTNAGVFHLRGIGSIFGVVYQSQLVRAGRIIRFAEKQQPAAFMAVTVGFTQSIPKDSRVLRASKVVCMTDEFGRFEASGIPAGEAQVTIPFEASGNIFGGQIRDVYVLEGKGTEVRFYDDSPDWEIVCKMVVGDGSESHFASGLGVAVKEESKGESEGEPKEETSPEPAEAKDIEAPIFEVYLTALDKPSSFPIISQIKLDENKEIHLHDVHPGKYRMILMEAASPQHSAMSPKEVEVKRSLYKTEIEVKSGGANLSIPLGAGSVIGRVRQAEKFVRDLHVIAVGKKTREIRYAYCDENGDFRFRFLSNDSYLLYAYNPPESWCKIGEVSVENNRKEMGLHELKPGGTIVGIVQERWLSRRGLSVLATDSQGITVYPTAFFNNSSGEFHFAGLWPGKWTVKMLQGDKVIAKKMVSIDGVKSTSCEFN